MARLLVVTDAPFRRAAAGVFNDLCYDRAFFEDYGAVFDEVRVAARMQQAASADGMLRADGQGVAFVDLADAQGARWVLAPWWRYCGPLAAAVDWADAVCVRLPAASGWHAARLARRLRKPLMFELIGDPMAAGAGSLAHNIGGLIQWRRTRWIARAACIGSYVSKAHLQRRYPPAPGARIDSISSIRLPRESFRPPRAAPARSDRLHLVCVGVLLAVKNHLTLLEALALGRREGLPLHLTLVGDGPLRPQIERRIAKLGIGCYVTLTGQLIGRAKVEAQLDAADLFVMPSWSEGLPRAAIEAMARGLPAIGSAVGGIRELLPEAHLFDPHDPNGIVGAVRKFLSPQFYRHGAVTCSEVVQQFASDVLCRRRQALYRGLREIATARQIKPLPLGPALASRAVR